MLQENDTQKLERTHIVVSTFSQRSNTMFRMLRLTAHTLFYKNMDMRTEQSTHDKGDHKENSFIWILTLKCLADFYFFANFFLIIK